MKYAIYIVRPGRLPTWHKWDDTGETISRYLRREWDRREDAEKLMSLCGLYRLLGYECQVRRVK